MRTETVYGYHYQVLLESEHGPITPNQEIFCWRYALHGIGMRAYREAYASKMASNGVNVNACRLLRRLKIVERIKALVDMHHRGDIDLSRGPWDYYGDVLEGIGDPEPGPYKSLTNKDILYALTGYEKPEPSAS